LSPTSSTASAHLWGLSCGFVVMDVSVLDVWRFNSLRSL